MIGPSDGGGAVARAERDRRRHLLRRTLDVGGAGLEPSSAASAFRRAGAPARPTWSTRRAHSYEPHGVVAMTDVPRAVERAKVRDRNTGRVVHEDVVRAGHKEVDANLEKLVSQTGMPITMHDTMKKRL